MVEITGEATQRAPIIQLPRIARPFARLRVDSRLARWAPLAAVVALAFGLNAWGAARSGYGNTYYSAAVRSMSTSWPNFFFGSFDSGGFITVDKPPVFLWVDALSVRIFGYSTLSLMLPSAVAGAASVATLWLIIRRYFDTTAATIAGAVLALTPISVAVNRLNLPEPFMILALVGAAGAVIRSLDSRRWWFWVALAGTLVGVAFNVKMLAAWIPGPALVLAIMAATRSVSLASARQLALRLAVLGATTLVVSASWMVIVDAWPASDRPYIGGSTDNTALDLALGYNGFGRVDGTDQAGGGPGGARPNGPAANTSGRRLDGGGNQQPPNFGQPPTQNGQVPPQGAPGGAAFTGAGGIVAGTPGLLRLFDAANGGQIGWLLPFALGAGLIALWSVRRDATKRAVVLLFIAWVGLYGGVFSYAQGIFHSYYTAALAPGVAALAGIGAASMSDAIRRDRRWLFAALVVIAVTAWVQLHTAGRTPDFYGWLRPAMIVAVITGGAAIVICAMVRPRLAIVGMVTAIAGLMLIPAAWSASVSANASLNSTLPQAGPQQGASGRTFGSSAFDNGTVQLAAWLKTNSDSTATWQLVVSSAMTASPLIAEYDVPVMALGGFSGRDQAIDVTQFADLVEAGKVRYVLVSNGGPGSGIGGSGAPGAGAVGGPGGSGTGTNGGASIMNAIRSTGRVVTDPGLPSQYQGQIYDVSGTAAGLRALVQ